MLRLIPRICILLWNAWLLAILRRNGWMDFQAIFKIVQMWYKEQCETFWGCFVQLLGFRIIFLFWWSVFVSHIAEKEWTDFYEIFSICRTWRETIDRLFHAWLDSFAVFRLGEVVCLSATLRKNGWMDFREILSDMIQGTISSTVSHLIRLFRVLHTRRGGGLQSRVQPWLQYPNWVVP